MNYDEVLKNLQTLAEIPLNQEDENFARVIPLMFAYGEGRIYRELDFLATTTVTRSDTIAKKREMALPVTVLVLRQLNVIANVPSSWSYPPRSGLFPVRSTRLPLERFSPELLDMYWPQEDALPSVPQKFAVIGTSTGDQINPLFNPLITPPPPLTQKFAHLIRFAPTPDQAYPVEFLGVVRPDPISPKNPETYLSITYPDLLCAACMVFIAGYQRDFGAQADDPTKAMSWNATYEGLRAGVMTEATRMKGIATSLVPAPGAP